jgi:RNA polymerase sigma factor (sigma-70 family)
MIDQSMRDLLSEYARSGSHEAFRRLVEKHVNSVYSQCLRQLGDPAAADDVTQQVFISLAQKATKLSPRVVLEGWLFTATRYRCANQRRATERRRKAERKAAIMRKEAVDLHSINDDFSSQADPLLDDAIARLGERDRSAVLLRFFQGQSLREVGDALGVSEDAAKQRVSRAVEKLRNYFAGRGIVASSEMIASALGCAVKPAAPHAVQTILSAALNPSAHAVMHAGGLLSKIVAWFAAAGTVTAAAVVVGRIALAQTPAPQQPVQTAPPVVSTVPNVPGAQGDLQSTPIDTLSRLCTALETNDVQTIDDCLCGDDTNQAQEDLGRRMFEEEGAINRISKAWQDKFNQPMAIPGYNFVDPITHHTTESALRTMLDVPGGPQMTIDGDDAQVRVPLPADYFAGTGPERMTFVERWSGALLVFNRVGPDWKLNTDRTFNMILSISRMRGNNVDVFELGAKIEQSITDALNDVAGKIESGSIRTRTQAAREVRTQMGQAFQSNQVNGFSVSTLPVIGGSGIAPAQTAVAEQPNSGAQSAPQSGSTTQPDLQATPIGALSKLCAAIEADDASTIDDCLCSDGTNQAEEDLGRGMFHEEAAAYRISKAWRDKFGQRLSVSGLSFDDFAGGHTVQSALRAMMDVSGGLQVTIDGDDARVRVPLPPEYFAGSGPNRLTFLGRWSGATLVFNRIGPDWKLNTDRTVNFIDSVSRMSGNDVDIFELGATIAQGIADSLNDVASKIEGGSIHSHTQAARAVQTGVGHVFRDNHVNGSSFTALPVIGG